MGQAELSRQTLHKVKKAAAPSPLKVDDGPPPFLLHQSVFCVTILASDELTGLGTLILVSGSFILKFDERQKQFYNSSASEKEYLSKSSRGMEFTHSAVEAVGRVSKRTTQLNLYLQSNKNQINPDKVNQMVEEGSVEAANDSGLLAGYTSGTTGLPASFHQSVNEYFKTELDFWHSLDGAISLPKNNPKAIEAKRLELLDRTQKIVYSSSLLLSSWTDMGSATKAEAEKNVKLVDALMADAQHEHEMMQLAFRTLKYSLFSFLLLVGLLLIDRERGVSSKKRKPPVSRGPM
jgi:hypothetical protein